MKTFFSEFKKFITRGNIVDMSVGVIVGGAFTSIVNALSNNILKPVINWILAMLLGTNSLSGIYTYLKRVDTLDAEGKLVLDAAGNKVADLTQSIYIDWGAFINAIINFLIIAFVLFVIVRSFNKLNDANRRTQDLIKRIEWKQENNFKLTRREKAFVAKREAEAKANQEAQEAKALADEQAAKQAQIEAEKVARKEQIQEETLEVLKELKGMLNKNA